MEDLSLVLHKNSSVLMQKKVRENLDIILPDKTVKISGEAPRSGFREYSEGDRSR